MDSRVSLGSVVLVALLHAGEHLLAVRVIELVGRSTEVRLEESTERGDGNGTSGGSDNLGGVGRSEEKWGMNLESLEIGMSELTNGHGVATLEGMSGNEGGVSVIYIQIIYVNKLCKC